jgi:nucleoside-diphosphate-sugar epimerase
VSKRVLVTGGAGYIGSVLCDHLLQRGHTVTVLDNVMYGTHSLLQFCASPRFSFELGDARDERLVGRLVDNADVIIPLAAIVGAPACDRDPRLAETVNRDAVLLADRLRTKGQLLIYLNTNSGYGTSSGEMYCTEDTPLEPISVYGTTKVDAERAVRASENVIVFRLATVFGTSPRMRLDLLVNHFVYAAVTDRYLVIFEKDFKRNFVHIRDVADAVLYAIDHPDTMAGNVYNLGLDSANLSKAELAEKIQQHVPNFYVHYAEVGSDPDKRNYIVSNQRLRDAGFEASRSIDAAIPELIGGYKMLGRGLFKNV